MKRIVVLFILLSSLTNACGQANKSLLRKLSFTYNSMENECSMMLLAHVTTDKKGRIDTVSFIAEGNSLFAQDIRNGLTILKQQKEKISKKDLLVLFVYSNESKSCNGESCLKSLAAYQSLSTKFFQRDCIFIGPVFAVLAN